VDNTSPAVSTESAPQLVVDLPGHIPPTNIAESTEPEPYQLKKDLLDQLDRPILPDVMTLLN
jgi:hypothetical protein